MKSTVLWSLVGLNAVLLFLFVGQFTRPSAAQAQFARPSDYLLIPGVINGQLTSAVYIIDTTQGALSAVAYDDSTHALTGMPAVDLNAVYNAASRR
jgi:hypothetical protein